jgi:hypothetical protein
LVSNSTEILREVSTCVLCGAAFELPGIWRSATDSTLMPSAAQMCRYIGTSA